MNLPRFCTALASLTIALAVLNVVGCSDGSTVVSHGQDGVNLVYTINSDGNLSDGYGGV